MLENLLKTDNLEKVKAKLEDLTKSILNEEFEARPEKGLVIHVLLTASVIMWNLIEFVILL